MKLKKVLLEIVVTAAVAALTASGTTYLALHFLPHPILEEARVEKIARDYLIMNPEILIEMGKALDARQAVEQQSHAANSQQKVISENAEAIFRSPASYVAGNPNGDVTVVEFFDYNCGFCRKALPDVIKLVDNDKNVRLVLKELPIFGKDSVAAAKLTLAAKEQGKYFEMHQRLLTDPGRANEQKALQIAKELGLDLAELQKDAQAPEIEGALVESKGLAHKLQGERLSTPYYLIGDRPLDGVSENFFDQLKATVEQVRRKG